MQKQSTRILDILSNIQKTIETLKSISNTQETCISKILKALPNMATCVALRGGAAN